MGHIECLKEEGWRFKRLFMAGLWGNLAKYIGGQGKYDNEKGIMYKSTSIVHRSICAQIDLILERILPLGSDLTGKEIKQERKKESK